MNNYYTCHSIEWDNNQTCLICDAVTTETKRIQQLILHEADTWSRPLSFSYRVSLRKLAEQLQNKDVAK